MLILWHDAGGIRYKTQHSYHNGGGGGPFSDAIAAPREEIIQRVLLGKLKGCAHMIAWAGGEGSERRTDEAQRLANWIIQQLPPLMYPAADAAGFFAAQLEQESTECSRVRTLARAKHAIEERARAAMTAAKRFGYDRLILNPDSTGGAVSDDRFPGRYEVEGETPDALRVTIHAKPGHKADAAILAAQTILRDATGLAVRIEGRK